MKKQFLATTFFAPAVLIAMSGSVAADYNDGYGNGTIEEARVLSAEPIYRTVQINDPVEECWQEQVRVPVNSGHKSYTPTIIGAIVGAAVGNEFGSGRGRHAATAAGAVLGGSIGRDAQARHSPRHTRVEYQQRCEVVDRYRTEQRIDGYDVTYRYNGQVMSTVTQNDPGRTMRVNVSVVPVE